MVTVAGTRLYNQQIERPRLKTPGEVVSWLGAVQAQDYPGAKWSVGLRLPGSTDASIEQAISDRTIVRTWPMRGTLHFVAAADVRWMLGLLGKKVIDSTAGRRRELGLDEATIAKSGKLLEKALSGGKELTKDEFLKVFAKAKIATDSYRWRHILFRHALEGLICFGPMRGKQPTFVLLEEWVPPAKSMDRAQSLALLAERYFTSRAPATLQDFVWWSGLNITDARAGIAAVPKLVQETRKGKTYWIPEDMPAVRSDANAVYLLPGFDEYLLGYTDRSAALGAQYGEKHCPGGNGMFSPTIIVDGKVAGIWKRTMKKSAVDVEVSPFRKLTSAHYRALADTVRRYGGFLGLPASFKS